MTLLIIGYGNTLRGDDGVGWVAAQALAGAELESLPRWDIVISTEPQLTPELAHPISQASRVIFIDAAVSEPEVTPGTVRCRVLEPPPTAAPSAFVHHLDPALLLLMAARWYGTCPPALLITVTGAVFDYRETLSAEVQAAIPQVVEMARVWLAE